MATAATNFVADRPPKKGKASKADHENRTPPAKIDLKATCWIHYDLKHKNSVCWELHPELTLDNRKKAIASSTGEDIIAGCETMMLVTYYIPSLFASLLVFPLCVG